MMLLANRSAPAPTPLSSPIWWRSGWEVMGLRTHIVSVYTGTWAILVGRPAANGAWEASMSYRGQIVQGVQPPTGLAVS